MWRRRLLPLGCLAAVVAVMVWIGLVFQNPPDTLLLGARRVCVTPAGNGWLSDHEALHFTGSFATGWTAMAHDIRTGTERRLDGLTRLMRASKGLAETTNLSPDGRRVLYITTDLRLVEAAVDGQSHSVLRKRGAAALYWCEDSRHWVEYVYGVPSVVVVHDGGAPKTTALTFPAGAAPSLPLFRDGAGRLSMSLVTWNASRPVASQVVAIDPHVPRLVPTTVPAGFQPGGAWLSPDGGRVLGIRYRPATPAALWWLFGRVPGVRARLPQGSYVFYVQSSTGGSYREVGAVRAGAPSGPVHSPSCPVLNPTWLPGGKAISFTYMDSPNGSLWVRPVD